jgi:hypothetical protein
MFAEWPKRKSTPANVSFAASISFTVLWYNIYVKLSIIESRRQR